MLLPDEPCEKLVINVFLERRDAKAQSFYFLRTQIAQIKGMISLTLVMEISTIPKICGCFFRTQR